MLLSNIVSLVSLGPIHFTLIDSTHLQLPIVLKYTKNAKHRQYAYHNDCGINIE